jgi:lysine 2,3-aminomutase
MTILNQTNGLLDPIGDSIHHKGFGVIHRYKCRALLLISDICHESCAHCFRQNSIGSFNFDLEFAISYLKNHPEIYELILSGGDPFSLSSSLLITIINKISQIETVNFLRFHTRTVVTSKEKTDEKIFQNINNLLKKQTIKNCSIALHINHPNEITELFLNRLNIIKKYDIDLLSQTVLLNGINNSSKTLTELFLNLYKHKIRPYYLHHPDKVKGGMQFQLSYEEGAKIYSELKHTLPGYMIPHYALDGPSGKKRAPFFS